MVSPYTMSPPRPAAPPHDPVFTGVVTAPPGTAATPGLRFSPADGGTGLYQAASGALGFATGGTARMRLDAHLRSYANVYILPATGNPAMYLWGGDTGNGWALFTNATVDDTAYLAEYAGGAFVANRLAVQKGGTTTFGGVPGGEAVRVVTANPAGNRLQLEGAPIGGSPRVAAAGADATVNLRLAAKGAGCIVLESLPNSAAGLPAGGLWNDQGTLRVA